ncbi:MAG TPA: ATP-binding protein [Anaerolineae bacterium]|nr:ATP-binding protein [Anaerolineae bacterium]HQK12788.1 ATP-binding protein [Anaerolineae bacterium]
MLPDKLTPEELEHLLSVQRETVDTMLVDNVHLLRLMPQDAREALTQTMTEQTFAPGEVVFHEGDAGNIAYLVWSGQALVMKGNLESPTILGLRGPGDILGEMALLENQPRSASIIALTDLRVLQIHQDDFMRLLGESPSVSADIMATISTRLRAADTIRDVTTQIGYQLKKQVSELKTREEELLAIQQMRQETVDLIVHDLRNPLNILINVLEMLDVTMPPEIRAANQQLLNVGRSAYSRMRRLIDTLLDTSRLEAGEMHLNRQPTDIAELIHTTITSLTPLVMQRNVRLHPHITSELPYVVIDAELIERVLYNLMDNALKYAPSGDITVAATLQDKYIVVSVNDTGPGIPPAEREHIFDRFVQVSGTEKHHQGFGLGLRFCYLVVRAHGGKIWVETGDNGIGSKFVFTLPLQD